MTILFMRHIDGEYDCNSSGITLTKQTPVKNCPEWNRTCHSPLTISAMNKGYPAIVHFVYGKPWNADCGVVNKGKNREVFEPLYQKWYETAKKVKTQYGVSFPKKKSNTGKKVGLGALAVGLLTVTGIIAKKTYDNKHNKIVNANKPNLATSS